jgi:hypothetical protein
MAVYTVSVDWYIHPISQKLNTKILTGDGDFDLVKLWAERRKRSCRLPHLKIRIFIPYMSATGAIYAPPLLLQNSCNY